MGDNYEALTVKQLKDEAAKRDGLVMKSSLRKAEIIERLREWDQEQDTAPEVEEEAEEAKAVAATPQDAGEDVTGTEHKEGEESQDGAPEDKAPLSQDNTPPAIETAPREVSALSEPEKEPTPPPHHAAVVDVAIPPESSNTLLSESKSYLTSAQNDVPPSKDTSVSPSEVFEDQRKRKRRSLTPPVVAEEVEAKRAKIEDNKDTDVSFTEAAVDADVDVKVDRKVSRSPSNNKGDHIQHGARATINLHSTVDKEDLDEAKEPARHLATCGLYISNLKRPLQEVVLRRYLGAVASPKIESDEKTDLIKIMYLDQVKTHALVLFDSVASASRARAATHGHKFPTNETGRDPLFVDFIPEDKVEEWIKKEKDTDGTGRTGGIRWHVRYTPEGEAIHEEVSSAIGRPGAQPPTGPRNPSIFSTAPASSNAPPNELFPRRLDPTVHPSRMSNLNSNASATHSPHAQPAPRTDQNPLINKDHASSFKALDDRFSRTTAKPSLYYKRVDPALAEKRLDELDAQSGRAWRETDRRINDEMWRYSFEGRSRNLVTTGFSRGSQRIVFKERDLERKHRRETRSKR